MPFTSYKNKEHLAFRNNFRVTKTFLIAKFDYLQFTSTEFKCQISSIIQFRYAYCIKSDVLHWFAIFELIMNSFMTTLQTLIQLIRIVIQYVLIKFYSTQAVPNRVNWVV